MATNVIDMQAHVAARRRIITGRVEGFGNRRQAPPEVIKCAKDDALAVHGAGSSIAWAISRGIGAIIAAMRGA